jgi:hypothetical protein
MTDEEEVLEEVRKAIGSLPEEQKKAIWQLVDTLHTFVNTYRDLGRMAIAFIEAEEATKG